MSISRKEMETLRFGYEQPEITGREEGEKLDENRLRRRRARRRGEEKQLANSDVTTEEEKKKGVRGGDGGWSGWSRRSES